MPSAPVTVHRLDREVWPDAADLDRPGGLDATTADGERLRVTVNQPMQGFTCVVEKGGRVVDAYHLPARELAAMFRELRASRRRSTALPAAFTTHRR